MEFSYNFSLLWMLPWASHCGFHGPCHQSSLEGEVFLLLSPHITGSESEDCAPCCSFLSGHFLPLETHKTTINYKLRLLTLRYWPSYPSSLLRTQSLSLSSHLFYAPLLITSAFTHAISRDSEQLKSSQPSLCLLVVSAVFAASFWRTLFAAILSLHGNI